MKVQSVMSSPARTCPATSDLGAAARMMLDYNCGYLPVLDTSGRVVGIITDRDICTTVASRHQSPWHIPVREAMTPRVFSCGPDDDVNAALALMGTRHVRRLPVIDGKHRLRGVISIDDAARSAGKAEGQISPDAVVRTLRRVSRAAVSV